MSWQMLEKAPLRDAPPNAHPKKLCDIGIGPHERGVYTQ